MTDNEILAHVFGSLMKNDRAIPVVGWSGYPVDAQTLAGVAEDLGSTSFRLHVGPQGAMGARVSLRYLPWYSVEIIETQGLYCSGGDEYGVAVAGDNWRAVRYCESSLYSEADVDRYCREYMREES